MHTRDVRWLLLVVMGLVIAMIATPVFADEIDFDCKMIAGLTHRIAGCIRFQLDNAAALYFSKFYPVVQYAITAVLTLAITIYGVKLSMGMVEKVGRDTFVLLVKIAIVTALVSKSDLIYKTIMDGMDGASQAVSTFVPPSGAIDAAGTESNQSKCMKNMVEQQLAVGNTLPALAPWLGVDCMLDTIIGIKVPRKDGDPVPTFDAVWYNSSFDAPASSSSTPPTSNSGLSRGLIYIFFSGFQTSVVGIVLAVVGGVFIVGTLLAVAQALFTYIASYIGIALLVILSPIFIPMVLLPATKIYFDKWVKLLVSFAMQPVLMLIFLIMTIAAVDLAVFSGSYSIMYRIAGDASRAANFDLNGYLTALRDDTGAESASCTTATCSPIINADPKSVAQVKTDNATDMAAESMLLLTEVGSKVSGTRKSKCTPEEIKKDTTGDLKKACSYTYPIKLWLRSIDWELMAKARRIGGNAITPADLPDGFPEVKDADGNNKFSLQAGQFILRELMAASFFCMLVVFVMSGMMKVVPAIIGGVIGDSFQTPNMANLSETLGGSNQTNVKSAGQAVMDRTGSKVGEMVNKIKEQTGRRGG